MPRTLLTPLPAPGFVTGPGLLVPYTAADVVNGNRFRASGADLVLARNATATPRTVTIQATPDHPFGREGDMVASITGTLVGPSYSAAVLVDAPYAYYRLGEASGTTAADSSGNGRHGTYATTNITLGATGLLTNGSQQSGHLSRRRVPAGGDRQLRQP